MIRVDRDTVQSFKNLQSFYQKVASGEPCILVGTQMLAKGHHFPRLTLVVILDVDQALFSPDFRAVERMGQLLVQVAGRAGRAEIPGQVLLQTQYPEHPYFRELLEHGYSSFARKLLKQRQDYGLPPYSFMAQIRAEHVEQARADKLLADLNAISRHPQI